MSARSAACADSGSEGSVVWFVMAGRLPGGGTLFRAGVGSLRGQSAQRRTIRSLEEQGYDVASS